MAKKMRSIALALGSALLAACPLAQAEDPGFYGTQDWIFYRYELLKPGDDALGKASIDLIAKLNSMLAKQGVTLAVTMVPIKVRLYQNYLPSTVPMTEFMSGHYAQMAQAMQQAGLNFIDLNRPFMDSPDRMGELPLFFKYDTHWAPPGVVLAANAIRKGIDANPALSAALAAVPQEKFSLNWDTKRGLSRARDLVRQLPKGSPEPSAPEYTQSFKVQREGKSSLTGDAFPDIALVGSSYSANWTQFDDALRFSLQRDLVPVSVVASQGFWYGMETYLRDDAFQLKRPKLLIWELPERDLRAGPEYSFRDEKYRMTAKDWLTRTAVLIESSCQNAGYTVQMEGGGAEKSVKKTKAGEQFTVSLASASGALDYLMASIQVVGPEEMTVQLAGDAGTQSVAMKVAGDEEFHTLKIPLAKNGQGGIKRVTLQPGATDGFALRDLKVCRLKEDPTR